jgi:hypothetical protein
MNLIPSEECEHGVVRFWEKVAVGDCHMQCPACGKHIVIPAKEIAKRSREEMAGLISVAFSPKWGDLYLRERPEPTSQGFRDWAFGKPTYSWLDEALVFSGQHSSKPDGNGTGA